MYDYTFQNCILSSISGLYPIQNSQKVQSGDQYDGFLIRGKEVVSLLLSSSRGGGFFIIEVLNRILLLRKLKFLPKLSNQRY